MFNFSLHLSFRFFALGFLCYDVDCIFFKTTGEFYFLFFLVRSLDFWIFEFSNFRFFGIFSNSIDSLSLQFYFFRISNIFFDFFLWCLRGLNSSFFISFLLKYIKTRFSLNKILLQLTGRLFGCCDEFDHQGRPRAQNQN